MAETITKTYKEHTGVINQCDVFRNVEFIEYVKEDGTAIEVSKVIFPVAIVLTQACDLQQDYDERKRNIISAENAKQDKLLISVIVAPMYNFEEFRQGTHLDQLGFTMDPKGKRNKSKCENIIKNENKRYHYIKFTDEVPLSESVIDFKHYFTVTMNYLISIYQTNYVCSIDSLYREQISQRFSNFLSRIGLPDPE